MTMHERLDTLASLDDTAEAMTLTLPAHNAALAVIDELRRDGLEARLERTADGGVIFTFDPAIEWQEPGTVAIWISADGTVEPQVDQGQR